MTVTGIPSNLSYDEIMQLSGKRWLVDGEPLSFVGHGDSPGSHPWSGGGEAIAYPLLSSNGEVAYYARFLSGKPMTEKRYERWNWLAKSGIHELAKELRGAPSTLLETQAVGRPDGIEFDFSCSLCEAVPGKTWELLKDDIREGLPFSDELRRRCISNLIRATAMLERKGVIHGDLSPANVIIDSKTSVGAPTLYVIDFDAFVALNSDADVSRLTAMEGGSYGTDGYCPPNLNSLVGIKEDELAPYSDRFGRDMLILEFLCFDEQTPFDPEEPVLNWDRSYVQCQLNESKIARSLPYIRQRDLFDLHEDDRATSEQMAGWTRTTMPPRIRMPSVASVAANSVNAGFGFARQWLRDRAGIAVAALDQYTLAILFIGVIAAFLLVFERLATYVEHDMTEPLIFGGPFILAKGVVAVVILERVLRGMSQLAFSRDEPHMVCAGRFGMVIPARTKLKWVTESTYRIITAVALTAVTCGLLATTTYVYSPGK